MKHVEVLFSPAEFERLSGRDLSDTACVVFDILRATTSIVTALVNGATGLIPVATIEEALALKARQPEILLAGERKGFRISRELTGTLDFDFGNSPREFTAGRVQGRTIAITTTNGTRGLRACAGARQVFAASFLNLAATADAVKDARSLLLVCSGTHEEASFEDTLAAGALTDLLWEGFREARIADSAQIARAVYRACASDLLAAMAMARNGRRLLAIPDLRDDVAFCLRRDTTRMVTELSPEGLVKSRAKFA